MIINGIKTALKEAALSKLKGIVTDAFDSKIKKEVKKATRRLTFKFIIAGVAFAGVCLLVSKSNKIVNPAIEPKN